MSDEQKKRFNKIVTDALNSSVYSRQVHDEYFGKNKFFTYGMESAMETRMYGMDLVARGAYVSTGIARGTENTDVKLVLSMQLPDMVLMYSTNHELAHVFQLSQFNKTELNQSPLNASFNDYLCMTMMAEMHAAIWEQEGVLLKYFDDLGQNKHESKKDYLAYADIEKKKFSCYVGGLLHDDKVSSAMHVAETVEQVTFYYYNDFSRQPKEEQHKSLMQARKATIKDFLSGMCANFYVPNVWAEYQGCAERRGQFNAAKKAMGIAPSFLGIEDSAFLMGRLYMGKVPTLSRLVTALNSGKEMFMPLADWQDAIGAKDNHEFAENLMMNSPHRDAYKKIVEENKRDGLLPS